MGRIGKRRPTRTALFRQRALWCGQGCDLSLYPRQSDGMKRLCISMEIAPRVSTIDREMVREPAFRSRSDQRIAQSSPRHGPVVAARSKNTPSRDLSALPRQPVEEHHQVRAGLVHAHERGVVVPGQGWRTALAGGTGLETEARFPPLNCPCMVSCPGLDPGTLGFESPGQDVAAGVFPLQHVAKPPVRTRMSEGARDGLKRRETQCNTVVGTGPLASPRCGQPKSGRSDLEA